MSLLNVKYDLEAELKSQKVGECLCVYGFYVYSSSYRYKSIINLQFTMAVYLLIFCSIIINIKKKLHSEMEKELKNQKVGIIS